MARRLCSPLWNRPSNTATATATATPATKVPSAYPHPLYNVTLVKGGGVYEDDYESVTRAGTSTDETYDPNANIVSSRIVDDRNLHTVMLDIDIPAELVPSSTPGHSHLYIDKPMTWRQYKRLLRALKNAGIIEEGYYRASMTREATHLRTPGAHKQ